MVSMNELFAMMQERGASDLHLAVGTPPTLRVDGQMVATPFEKLTPEAAQQLVFSLLTEDQRRRFETSNELDMAFSVKGFGRMRMNVLRQRGCVGAVLRAIPGAFKNFKELGLPAAIADIMKIHKGLILVTGPTGSGKSTTLASMIDYLNEHVNGHIITMEDPIEYVHSHKKCVVNQREVGQDTESFASALKHALRQDPNIILVGELRDMETISAALTIAETGHLVFATLHTNDCVQSINRIIDVFPSHQMQQVRVQLSFVLQAVMCQQLIMAAGGAGRVLAAEFMIVTPAIRNLIREEKVEQIQLSLQTGAKYGMQTMNQCLADLYRRGRITFEEGMARSMDTDDFKRICQQRSTTAAVA